MSTPMGIKAADEPERLLESETTTRSPAARAAVRPRSDGARFTPGAMLAGRFRIVAPLGKGGMGEVYRADDTRLGQPVALKFLPPAFANDQGRLDRLYAEVRIGRQVSHPNVCRIHDIVEAEGHHFVAMEYVDGEDLASLLRRIGRLPLDKAVEIGRDISLGLAAAHDQGVVHRDLKPANVMIDGRGRARLTDFGLAALAADVPADEVSAGTPSYMAPEQLAGSEVTFRSDLYALGLVLYEVFTGKRLFDAKSMPDLLAQHREAKHPSLSSSVRDLDPALEQAIVGCLEEDPARRPPSVHTVIAALPSRDPLQAALAAGETPSPALVAAAGMVGDLRPGVAWTCLGTALLGLVLVSLLARHTVLVRRVSLPKPPDALVERGEEILARLGYSEKPGDTAYYFSWDDDYLAWVTREDQSPGRWDRLAAARPGPVYFLYRQSPSSLLADTSDYRVTAEDPPLDVPGMINLKMDPQARLIGLHAVPPRKTPAPAAAPDWSVLLAAAGLDAAALKTVAPAWTPPVASETRAAWEGTYPNQPGVPIRVEAAASGGKPIWFEVLGPWNEPRARRDDRFLAAAFAVLLGMAIWLGFLVLAWRNLRLGRGDRPGALRLGVFVFVITAAAVGVRADHVSWPVDEVGLIVGIVARALFWATHTALVYLAIEPQVRRRWPRMLVSWTRLLGGRVRDPLVGRDILVGSMAGVAVVVVQHLGNLAPAWFGAAPLSPYRTLLTGLSESRHLVFWVLQCLSIALFSVTGSLFTLLLFRSFLRRDWLVLAVIVTFNVVPAMMGLAYPGGMQPLSRGEHALVESVGMAVYSGVMLTLLFRAGILAGVAAFFFLLVLQAAPLAFDASAWYAGRGVAVLLALAALLAWAFHTSLGGKPLFGTALLED